MTSRVSISITALCLGVIACSDKVDSEILDAGTCDFAFCEQVLVPEGSFPMGADREPECGDGDLPFGCGDERPLHWVHLGDFYIDKYETTHERYDDCVQRGPCSPSGHKWGEKRAAGLVVNHYPPQCDPEEGGDIANCPYHAVNCKTWEQADVYCRWIGRRLCTEAEWERAANGPGPDQRLYPWGDTSPSENDEVANFFSMLSEDWPDSYIDAVDDHAAGQSIEGVYNLAGNVEEWVGDFYGPYPSATQEAPVADPSGPAAGELRITRGGCLFSGGGDTDYEYGNLRNTGRATQDPAFDWG